MDPGEFLWYLVIGIVSKNSSFISQSRVSTHILHTFSYNTMRHALDGR